MSKLNERSRRIPEELADARSVEQILARDLTLRYEDVATAAREALAVDTIRPVPMFVERRREHARAYEPWTTIEEEQLKALVEAGVSIGAIAAALARQTDAIRSRLAKLGLDGETQNNLSGKD